MCTREYVQPNAPGAQEGVSTSMSNEPPPRLGAILVSIAFLSGYCGVIWRDLGGWAESGNEAGANETPGSASGRGARLYFIFSGAGFVKKEN
jgi:hypothetical protein